MNVLDFCVKYKTTEYVIGRFDGTRERDSRTPRTLILLLFLASIRVILLCRSLCTLWPTLLHGVTRRHPGHSRQEFLNLAIPLCWRNVAKKLILTEYRRYIYVREGE